MSNTIKMSSVLIFLFLTSFNTTGKQTKPVNYEATSIKLEKADSSAIADTLYQERIKNINRLEQIKYAVHKMAN